MSATSDLGASAAQSTEPDSRDTEAATAIPARGPSKWLVAYRLHERLLLGFLGIALLLAAWQLSADRGWVDPLFTSSPSAIADKFKSYYSTSKGWHDLAVSGKEFAYGFVLALIVGLALGILMGRSKRFDALIEPIFNFLYSSPRIALVPLFIIWFGIGTESKVAIVFLAASLPLALNARLGVLTPPRDLVNLATSLGANRFQMFWSVLLPGAVPAIVAGIRLAIGQGLVGVIVGELVASTAGIGYTMSQAGANFDTPQLFVGLLTVAGAGVLLTSFVRALERRLEKWRVS